MIDSFSRLTLVEMGSSQKSIEDEDDKKNTSFHYLQEKIGKIGLDKKNVVRVAYAVNRESEFCVCVHFFQVPSHSPLFWYEMASSFLHINRSSSLFP